MNTDVVTGATVEVVTEVASPPEQVWEWITAVGRIGEWSPECVDGAWSGADTKPRVGARFTGVNRFGGVFENTVVCEVVAADEPRTFAWAVLDDEQRVDRAGSIWSYELEPLPDGRTSLRHRFVHGPGLTGVREPAEQQPERATAIVAGRLRDLVRNMQQTLTAMTGSTTFSTTSRLEASVSDEVMAR